MKYRGLGIPAVTIPFLVGGGGRSPDRGWAGGFLERPLPWAVDAAPHHRPRASHSFPLCKSSPGDSAILKGTSPSGRSLQPYDQFDLQYLLKGRISKYSHTGTESFDPQISGDTIQSTSVPDHNPLLDA